MVHVCRMILGHLMSKEEKRFFLQPILQVFILCFSRFETCSMFVQTPLDISRLNPTTSLTFCVIQDWILLCIIIRRITCSLGIKVVMEYTHWEITQYMTLKFKKSVSHQISIGNQLMDKRGTKTFFGRLVEVEKGDPN